MIAGPLHSMGLEGHYGKEEKGGCNLLQIVYVGLSTLGVPRHFLSVMTCET